MDYILSDKDDGCFLCRVFGEQRDRDHLVLKRGATAAVVMNRYPYNNGHLMIAPYRHIDCVRKLDAEERAECMDLLADCIDVLERTMRPDGFNAGLNLGRSAGAGLEEHIHFHVVPRWNGDTNFMPVFAETNVIPQALTALYDQLKRVI